MSDACGCSDDETTPAGKEAGPSKRSRRRLTLFVYTL